MNDFSITGVFLGHPCTLNHKFITQVLNSELGGG